jgi:thymidylate kinase
LVLVAGPVPGVGKSSLAAALAARLDADDRRVELFREEHIRSDSAFTDVMEEFESSGEVLPDTLIAASASYVKSVRDRGADVVVLDSLFPYLPSLLAWGYADDEIVAFFELLARTFEGFPVVELHLVGTPRRALARAARREGGVWLADHIAKVSQFRVTPRASTWADTVAYYEVAATRSESLLERAPWPVVRIDADNGAATALTDAAAAISALFDGW